MTKIIGMQDSLSCKEDISRLCSLHTEIIDASTKPLIHQMSRFWYISHGRGTIRIQDTEYKVKPGTLVSILPWQISEVTNVTSPIHNRFLIYYYDNINSIVKSFYNTTSQEITLSSAPTQSPIVYCTEVQQEKIQQVFMEIHDELLNADSNVMSNLYITNKLIELTLLSHRYDAENATNILPKETPIQQTDILRYMYNHLSEKLTLRQLSRLFYMSESSISRYITQTTGLSFFDLLNEMRVGKTMNFLLYTDFTLEELAEILGFVDSSHICKVFSSRIGMKANDFRKTYQQVSNICNIKDSRQSYEIVSYIYRNYQQELTPQTVADHFCISVKKLNAILLYQVEKNFSDFLNFIRINHASILLKTTDKTILDIALEVGYNNTKTLNRNFLKYRLMTPDQFRKTITLQTGNQE